MLRTSSWAKFNRPLRDLRRVAPTGSDPRDGVVFLQPVNVLRYDVFLSSLTRNRGRGFARVFNPGKRDSANIEGHPSRR